MCLESDSGSDKCGRVIVICCGFKRGKWIQLPIWIMSLWVTQILGHENTLTSLHHSQWKRVRCSGNADRANRFLCLKLNLNQSVTQYCDIITAGLRCTSLPYQSPPATRPHRSVEFSERTGKKELPIVGSANSITEDEIWFQVNRCAVESKHFLVSFFTRQEIPSDRIIDSIAGGNRTHPTADS
jgi:hypothetical protein